MEGEAPAEPNQKKRLAGRLALHYVWSQLNTKILSLNSEPEKAREDSLNVLRENGIILFPTETVYGLGVNFGNKEGIEKLYDLKGRPKEKPFQWMAHDVSVVKVNSSEWDESIEKLAKAFWPGPVTLVLRSRGGETIGWRIPKHEWLLSLLSKLGNPLIATSANLSGQPTPNDFEAVIKPFQNRIELAVDGGPPKLGVASTVIEKTSKGFKILREGAILRQELLKVISLE
jgi:L-threonylcarbamoyladenylate synthase